MDIGRSVRPPVPEVPQGTMIRVGLRDCQATKGPLLGELLWKTQHFT